MEGLRPVHLATRFTRMLARLAVGVTLFAWITPSTAAPVAQPEVCRSAAANLITT